VHGKVQIPERLVWRVIRDRPASERNADVVSKPRPHARRDRPGTEQLQPLGLVHVRQCKTVSEPLAESLDERRLVSLAHVEDRHPCVARWRHLEQLQQRVADLKQRLIGLGHVE
jgi:hypothetical protein